MDKGQIFPGQTGFSVINLKYAIRWYEVYNQDNINRQRLVDEIPHQVGEEFEMPIDFGKLRFGLPMNLCGLLPTKWRSYFNATVPPL